MAIEAGEEVADFAEEFVEAEAVEGDSILELGMGKAIRARARGGTREKNVYGRFLMSSKAREQSKVCSCSMERGGHRSKCLGGTGTGSHD